MLLVADGFDHYGSADAALFAWTFNIAGAWKPGGTNRARTGDCFGWPLAVIGAGPDPLERNMGVSVNQCYVGFALKMMTLGDTFNGNNFFSFNLLDSAGGVQMSIQIDETDGTVRLYRGQWGLGGVLLIETPYQVIFPAQFAYIEFAMKVSDTDGVLEMRVNDERVALYVGDTQATANANVRSVRFDNNRVFGTPEHFVDDFYFADNSGVSNNDFLGPIHCRTLLPTGNTAVADWTPTSGTGFQMLDNVPYFNLDYIEADADNEAAEFIHQSVPLNTGGVLAVIACALVGRSGGGPNALQLGFNSNGTVSQSADIAIGAGLAFAYNIAPADPKGGGPWQIANVNALRSRLQRTE